MIGSYTGTFLSVWSDLARANHEQRHVLSWRRLEKGEHQQNPWWFLDLWASTSLLWIFWQDSGACPPLGTHPQPGCSLHVRPRGYLEALCIEAHGLTDKQQKKMLKSGVPFRLEDWDSLSSS
jgi:hypothetical protein